jgi:hypothetical protein
MPHSAWLHWLDSRANLPPVGREGKRLWRGERWLVRPRRTSETPLGEAGTGYQIWLVYIWVDSGQRLIVLLLPPVNGDLCFGDEYSLFFFPAVFRTDVPSSQLRDNCTDEKGPVLALRPQTKSLDVILLGMCLVGCLRRCCQALSCHILRGLYPSPRCRLGSI